MSGIRGSQAFLVAAKQTGLGVAPTAWQDTYFFEGGNVSPSRATDQLSETDNSRKAGDFYVTQTAVEGSPEVYVRSDSIHHLLEYALGTRVTATKVHTITEAASLPYITVGKGQGAMLWEAYSDVKVDSLDLSWSTASPGVATVNLMGRASTRQTEEWKTALAPPAASSKAPLNYNGAVVKLAGAETHLVSSFELSISNGVTLQQTDRSVPLDVIEGTSSVTGGFDIIFANLEQYNLFHYGSTSGTVQSAELATTSFEIELGSGENSLKFKLPKVAYTEFPVEPDPGGAPVVASVKFAAQRNSEGFVIATVKNGIET